MPAPRLARQLLFAPLFALLAACGQPHEPGPDPQPVAVDLLTWNLKDFPQTNGSTQAVAAVLADLDPELLCVQEVYSIQAFMGLLAELPGYTGILPAGGDLGLGILWKPDHVDVGPAELLFPAENTVFIREPVQVTAEILSEGAVVGSLTLVALHLKAGAGSADEATRRQAMELLEDHVQQNLLGRRPVIVMGDFNEALSDPNSDAVFNPWTSDPASYRFLTEPLARAGTVTFLPGGVMLDHVVSTTDLDGPMGEHQPEVPRLDQQITNYQNAVSDHLPITLRLDFGP